MVRYAVGSLVSLSLLLAACGDSGTGPDPEPGEVLDLNVGEVAIVRGTPGLDAVSVDGNSGTYLFVPANANATPDVSESYSLSFTPTGSASLSLETALADVEPMRDDGSPLAPMRVHHQFEGRLRALERSTLDFRAAQARLLAKRQVASAAAAFDISLANPTVGDAMTIRVPNAQSANLCTGFITTQATVKAVSTRAVIVQDNASPLLGFTDTDFQAIAAEFDALIFPTNVQYFGNPSDRDANGGRILIYYTPEVNKLTPANSSGFVGGFFWSGDLFDAPDCQQSNQAEIFYLLVPDPTGSINNNTRTTAQVRQGTRGTIAHELQHMINAGRRLTEGVASAFEVAWLDEALSHLAEDLVGRQLYGFGEFQNLTWEDIQSRGTADYVAFFFQNLARYREWQRRPDTSAATSKKADTQLAYRGAAWAFLRHAVDQYSAGNLANLTRRLVGGPETSVLNLTSKTGAPFDSLMVGWMIANYADDAGVNGLPEKYTFRSWNFRSASAGANNGTFPLRVTDLPNDFTMTQSLLSGTGVYYRKNTGGSSGTFTFGMKGPGGAPLTAAGARLYVLRVN